LVDAKSDINKTTADGSSALLVAIQNGHYDVGRFLIERGAAVSLTNQKGWSPLYLAIKNRTIETGELPVPLNANQAMDFIKLLLDRGAEVNGRLAFETETHAASHVIWLREEGATPFFRAAYGGDIEVLKLLLAHGADPNITTADHTTPLMALVGVGYTIGVVNNRSHEEDMESLKLLLELGAPVNAANDLGITALMGAAHRGVNDMIQLLVEHGAKLDARDKGTYCGYGRKDGQECPGGVTALSYAEGLPVTGEAPVNKPETAEFLAKIMVARGIPIPKENLEHGGGASKNK
jgi:ankyrin repeat protein